MQLIYFRHSGNFGDDLNETLWRNVLPDCVFDADDVLLMGIGSIFNEKIAPRVLTQGKRVFVLGSGAGYGSIPEEWKKWNILAVRGPLTAKLIDRPELAITDSAALIASLPKRTTTSDRKSLILLMPHYHSVARGRWKQVASEAGLTFVDPSWPVPTILDYFSRAKLIVTEAMHGAIVADALRIPWIPIVIGPDALPFKWRDWTLSLNLPYNPIRIPPSSTWETLCHRRLIRKADRQGIVSPALVSDISNASTLVSDFRRRYNSLGVEEAGAPKGNLMKCARSLIRSASDTVDSVFIRGASKHLRKIASGRSYLSDEHTLSNRVSQLQEAVNKFVKTIC